MDETTGNDSHTMNLGLSATQVTATVGAVCLALIIILGNVLVIFAFSKDKTLRSITNGFLVSLACADLLVGVLVIPMFTLDMIIGLNNEQWSGREALCYVFNVVDICASSASILHLCVISGDRYMAIVHPMTYPAKMTRKVSLVLIGAAWCLALVVSGLWIVLKFGPNRITYTTDRCRIGTSFAPLFIIISSCVSFFLPAIFMIIFYTKTFLTARAHIKRIQRGRMALSGDGGQDAMRIHRGGGAASNSTSTPAITMNSEYKAAKTLGIVIGAFLLCWLPFFTLNVISPLCTGQCKSLSSTLHVIYWLGYVNSALNPFIYAFTNSSFKVAFSKIICCLRNTRRDRLAGDSRPTMGQMSTQTINLVSHPGEFSLPHRYF